MKHRPSRFTLAELPLLCMLLAVLANGGLTLGCATAPDGSAESVLYPPPPQRPRIQFLTSINSVEDVGGERNSLMKFLVGDTGGSLAFRKPAAIAALDDAIYVLDPGWDSVIVIDLEAQTFEPLGDRGLGMLRVPVGIAIDSAGNKFIADTGRNQVVQFNDRNEFVDAFGNPEKLKPTGVAVDEQHLYIVNRNRSRVEVYDRFSKEQLRSFGKFGEGDGEFNIPTAITRSPSGNLFVTDAANFRVQEFADDGTFVKEYGFLGDGPGTFARPRGLGLDRDGHLYTMDAAFENAQIWDTSSAKVLLAFGGPGLGPGDMYLPASVFIDYGLVEKFSDYVDPDFDLEYVILVANNYGPNKVAIYGFITPKDPSRFPVYALPKEEPES